MTERKVWPQRSDWQRNHKRLVAVAAALVARDGAQVSLEEIAREAGVGSATLHRHFPSRLELRRAHRLGDRHPTTGRTVARALRARLGPLRRARHPGYPRCRAGRRPRPVGRDRQHRDRWLRPRPCPFTSRVSDMGPPAAPGAGPARRAHRSERVHASLRALPGSADPRRHPRRHTQRGRRWCLRRSRRPVRLRHAARAPDLDGGA
ncbi:helix-turn-helix domain-containing protein [Micromonospora qiuiae]|uniref:helix-turn-helix domain-containing protein n=1 Tax=Micromonospora qiuiae TaxID=502268 RepID=UPI00194FC9F5|nr:helix-turn-helix domain-containing protein [Micromonospora qiuiae]